MNESGGEAYYRQLCEQMGMALMATDAALHIRTWNAAAGRMFGAGAEAMIGAPVLSVLPQDRRIAAERMLRRAIEVRESGELEFQHHDAQAQTRELSASITPVLNDTGAAIGASICIRDVTRRIHLAAEVHESRKMVALGEMAGAIAHHFNNILGGIVTGIDYASANPESAVTRRVLTQTSRALMRASALVNGMLTFARGDPHSDDLSDLTEVLNDLAEETERAVQGRAIEFALDLPKLPVVPVPRAQLTTILRNMVQNAVEAMPEGGTLRIDASVTEAFAIIAVADTGRGLDEEARQRLFEPFWTTKRPDASGGVSGLGLAIAHGIAQVIGASISVASELQRGTTFTVAVPRVAE